MATLNEYITLVQNEVDDKSSEAKNVIQQAAKECYQEILEKVDGFIEAVSTQEISTIIGTASYTPNSFTEIYNVHYKDAGDYQELKRIEIQEYLEYINRENSTPEAYFIDGFTIKVAPAPVAVGTLKITYRGTPAELTVTSILPEKFTSIIKDGMIWRYYAYDNNPAANDYLAYYQNGIKRMQQEMFNHNKLSRPKLYNK
jgi:hypothetical protein